MVPEYRLDEVERNTSSLATSCTVSALYGSTSSSYGCEETLFDLAENARDYDLGEGD